MQQNLLVHDHCSDQTGFTYLHSWYNHWHLPDQPLVYQLPLQSTFHLGGKQNDCWVPLSPSKEFLKNSSKNQRIQKSETEIWENFSSANLWCWLLGKLLLKLQTEKIWSEKRQNKYGNPHTLSSKNKLSLSAKSLRLLSVLNQVLTKQILSKVTL